MLWSTLFHQTKDAANEMIASNPDVPFLVARLEAGSNSKALDAALKEFKSKSPKTSAMLFSVDQEANKIVCLAQVPKVTMDGPLQPALDSDNFIFHAF